MNGDRCVDAGNELTRHEEGSFNLVMGDESAKKTDDD